MERLTFRFAGERDTGLPFSFIRALAVCEEPEDSVGATPEVLRHWLFEEKRAEAVSGWTTYRLAGEALCSLAEK